MARDAIDFSYARPTPDAVASLGLDILVYTGPARPDKAYLDAMRANGIAVTLIQESDPNRAQQGYAAGVADAQYADGRADEVGYPVDASIAYVVSDGSATVPNTGADAIAAYAKGVQDTSKRPFFFYGNQYATDAAVRGAPKALGSWVPSTWGTATLLRQEANIPSPIADTDLNTVHQHYGAWGQRAPAPPDDLSFLNLLLEDDMYSVVSGSTPNTPIFQVWFRPNDGLVVKREIPATAGPLVVRDLTMGVAKAASVDGSNFKPFVVNQEVFDHIPKVS